MKERSSLVSAAAAWKRGLRKAASICTQTRLQKDAKPSTTDFMLPMA